MTHRVTELLDLARMDPFAVEDFMMMLAGFDSDEIEHVGDVVDNLGKALDNFSDHSPTGHEEEDGEI